MTLGSFAQTALWVLCPIQQLLIGVAMVRRKQIRAFPFFFAFLACHIVQFFVAFLSYRYSYSTYFAVYWVSEILDALLTLAVIQEVFSAVFAPYEMLHNLGVLVFRWVAIVLCLFVVISATVASGTDSERVIAGLLVMQRSTQQLQGGLLLFLFLFCRLFGITWRHYVFGIASGFAIIASILTVAAAIRTHVGPIDDTWYGCIQAAAFNIGLLVWLWHFRRSSTESSIEHPPSAAQLSIWNRALLELQK